MSESHFFYRKATQSDINALEVIRIKSILSCTIYSESELRVWSESIPNWSNLIDNTLVCVTHDAPVGFVVATSTLLDLLYLDPNYQGHGIADTLVSLVEKEGMTCDCNTYSEKVLKRRGWSFQSDNFKTKGGESFHNKWYIFRSK